MKTGSQRSAADTITTHIFRSMLTVEAGASGAARSRAGALERGRGTIGTIVL